MSDLLFSYPFKLILAPPKKRRSGRRTLKVASFPPLTMDDFKDHPIKPIRSSRDIIGEVARILFLELQQELSDAKKQKVSTENKNKKLSIDAEHEDVVITKNTTSKRRRPAATLVDKDGLKEQNEGQRKKQKKQRQQRRPLPTRCAEPVPDLLDEFKNKIAEMEGSEVTLLIQKSLYKTDFSPDHNRLSLPLNQIKKLDFLRESESRLFEKNKKHTLDVVLIEPSLNDRTIGFGKWKLGKTSSYVLKRTWTKVAKENRLTENDVVQVWSFRVQEKLCMALVKLP